MATSDVYGFLILIDSRSLPRISPDDMKARAVRMEAYDNRLTSFMSYRLEKQPGDLESGHPSRADTEASKIASAAPPFFISKDDGDKLESNIPIIEPD